MTDNRQDANPAKKVLCVLILLASSLYGLIYGLDLIITDGQGNPYVTKSAEAQTVSLPPPQEIVITVQG